MTLRYILGAAASLFLGVLFYLYLPSALIPIRPLPKTFRNVYSDTQDQRAVTLSGEFGKPHTVDLRSLTRKGSDSCICLEIIGRSPQCFLSCDQGSHWKNCIRSVSFRYTNISDPYGLGALRMAAGLSGTTLYDFKSFGSCEHTVSLDGGKTWETIKSAPKSGSVFKKCRAVSAGGLQGEHVYIWASDETSEGLWVSNDFGLSYVFLTRRVWYAVESSADSQRLYGYGQDKLWRSDDGGKNWLDLKQSEILFRPVFRGIDGNFRTWQASPQDLDERFTQRLIQIHPDPADRNLVYVLTYKGLYKSGDGGLSFVLLPLEDKSLYGIVKIAVDPVDPKYLYALTSNMSLMRSSDRGSSWHVLDIPMPQ